MEVDYLSNEVGKDCFLVDRLLTLRNLSSYAFTRLFLKGAWASLNFAFYSPSWFSWDSLVDPEFMAEHGPLMFRRSMRERARRHLSFSGDSLFINSRSTPRGEY